MSLKLVKELRDITGAGLCNCKEALIKTDGDIELAIKSLREAGIVKTKLRAEREGCIISRVYYKSSDGLSRGMTGLSKEMNEKEKIDFIRECISYDPIITMIIKD